MYEQNRLSSPLEIRSVKTGTKKKKKKENERMPGVF